MKKALEQGSISFKATIREKMVVIWHISDQQKIVK